MGHAEHFLSRLDRLPTHHIEEALLLYNDAPLLKAVLLMAKVAEGYERVALELDEGGPYLLVTREGHFVTCLGQGMIVQDAAIVSRKQLEVHASKASELRAKLELARTLTGKANGSDRLLKRLMLAGPSLSREEFMALSAWQPLLVVPLLKLIFECGEFMMQARERLEKTRLGKKNRAVLQILQGYWQRHWAMGHALVLLASEGPQTLELMPEEVLEDLKWSLIWGAIRQGTAGQALRGAWAVGRLGKAMLPVYKSQFRQARSPVQAMTAGLSLMALGLRHEGLRSEALKALMAEGPEQGPELTLAYRRMLQAGVKMYLAGPEHWAEINRGLAEDLLQRRARYRGDEPPKEGELTDEGLLRAAMCSEVANYLSDQKLYGFLPVLLGWIARLPAEELYAPSRQIHLIEYGAWTPQHTEVLMLPFQQYYGSNKAKPVKAQKPPERNAPCPCGSGKKYKKCCGPAGGAPAGGEGEAQPEEG